MKRFSTLFTVLTMAAVLSAFCAPAIADQITINIPSVAVTVTKDADGYAKFSFTDDRIQFISRTGEPAIPYLIIKALLPPGADLSTVNVQIERSAVTSDAVQSGETWNVKPTPPPSTWDGTQVITLDETPAEDPYAVSIRFPYDIVGTVSSGTLWDKQIGEWIIIDIPIALFHYNPITQGLFTLESQYAVITFEHLPSKRTSAVPVISSPSRIEHRLNQLAVNFSEIAPEYRTLSLSRTRAVASEKSGYVIITTRAIADASAQLQNFIAHKKNRGFNVYLMTEEIWGGGTGNTAAENIRAWLKANYVTLNLEYVLLIGNPNPSTGNVPMKMLWPRNNATRYPEYKDSPSDYYYADLTGNWDLDGDGRSGEYPDDFGAGGVDRNYEVIVGRIPYYGNSADLDSILAKSIAYQNEANQDWRKKVLLPMEPSDGSTPGYHLGEEIRNSVIAPKGWSSHRIYDSSYGLSPAPETVPCTVSNVSAAWNASDFGAVFWWTHGNQTSAEDIMDLSHAAALDNTHPAFTFQCSCTNSHPETTNNLSYSLLKNGAIAAVGATRVSWYWVGQTEFSGTTSNSGMTIEYARRLIGNEMKSGGYALHDIKQTLTPNNDSMWMNFTDFCLYGDPEAALISTIVSDAPPVISDIPEQKTKRDIAVTVPFTVSDDKTPAEDLTVTGSSSNTALVPNANLVFGGSGSERSVTITPAENQTGSAVITITVNDGKNTATKAFTFRIEQFAEWKWVYPNTPGRGNDLNDIWGSSENDVFAVGGSGVILHYDGIQWTEMVSGTFNKLGGIWGTSGNNVFAVGYKGTILHYDGITWKEMASGCYSHLYAIWGSSANNIFAVGEGGVLHYNGVKWSEMPIGTSSGSIDIWGSSANDIFVLSSNGIVFHYNGSVWSKTPTLPTSGWNAGIWGDAENNVFVVTSWFGEIVQYNGSFWTEIYKNSNWDFHDIWGSSANDVFAVGGSLLSKSGAIYHYDGIQWNQVKGLDFPKLKSIWGTSSSNVFAVGMGGAILHYDGNQWSKMTNAKSQVFQDIWGASGNDIFITGLNEGTYPFIRFMLHYDGTQWSETPFSRFQYIDDIWGSSVNDVYGVGSGIFHYDGNQWSEMLNYGGFSDIWGSSAKDVFAVGTVIFHYDGNQWTEMTIGDTFSLLGIWGSSADDVFAVGYEGKIFHYDSIQWTEISSGTSSTLNGVWGSSSSNVFAFGSGGTILHYDGIQSVKSV